MTTFELNDCNKIFMSGSVFHLIISCHSSMYTHNIFFGVKMFYFDGGVLRPDTTLSQSVSLSVNYSLWV